MLASAIALRILAQDGADSAEVIKRGAACLAGAIAGAA
jgi:hypothetical protein